MLIKMTDGRELPVEMHKVRIVQKTFLPPATRRLAAIEEAGYNTFLLRTRDLFLDMLTDSGTNAMSDNQLASMMVADDAYAGCESFYKLSDAVKEIFGFEYTLPVHQGRAAEHLLAKVFVKPGDAVAMNYHFTTTKAHFELVGGTVLELFGPDALQADSDKPFKGNMDLDRLDDAIKEYGEDHMALIRMEATTNLIGGQPFSLQNLRDVKAKAAAHGIPLVYDGSLIAENAVLIKEREAGYQDKSIQEIIHEMLGMVDILYLSGRKCAGVRGGMIATNNPDYYKRIMEWLPVYEGFATYGGMSTKEIEAMAVGIREMMDFNVASSGTEFVRYFVERMDARGVPVVTPAGGLACHVDAKRFLPHIPQGEYPAGALAAAIYIASGVRSMERGTLSTDRDKAGNNVLADLELARLAVPRRVYTMSQLEYAVDRVAWLYEHRDLVAGLKFTYEPPVLRFFFGKLLPLDNWGARLAEAFRADFGDQM